VVCILGEGSAQYAITAFWTASAYDIPVKFLVLRNHEYSILKWFSALENVTGAPGLDLPGLDVAATATSYGVASESASSPITAGGMTHQAATPACASTAVSASATTTPRALRQSSPTTKSQTPAKNAFNRLMRC